MWPLYLSTAPHMLELGSDPTMVSLSRVVQGAVKIFRAINTEVVWFWKENLTRDFLPTVLTSFSY